MAVTTEDIERLLVRLGGRRQEGEARAEGLGRELQELLLAAKSQDTDSDRIRRVAEAFASECRAYVCCASSQTSRGAF